MTLVYDLATADTFTLVTETTASVQVGCTPGYSLQHNVPTTLPLAPTTLVAGKPYFILLRSVNNKRAAHTGEPTLAIATLSRLSTIPWSFEYSSP